jgi:hypothetical protein
MAFSRTIRSVWRSPYIPALWTACLLLLSPAPAWPWGCDGHQAVARIAEKHMSKHAFEMANHLLQASPIDPSLSRFCGSQGLDALEDASTWADDIRTLRPEASPWHYINLPRGAIRDAVAESCPSSTGCVTSAIHRQLELLRNESTDARVRADALRFIIHLVGDLHQPLHCITNNDMGGNCVPVVFFGAEPIMTNSAYESYRPNLHAIWDSGIIQQVKGRAAVGPWADGLDGQFTSQLSVWEKEGINLEAWAWEAHQLAETVSYRRLPDPIPVERPEPVSECTADHHVSQRMLKLHEQVSTQYVHAVAPALDEQIAKAGVRLAMILNRVWP